MSKKIIGLFLAMNLPLLIFCQDYGWWNDLVDWDGHTRWHRYLQLSTSGLGPNALPVPEFHTDSIFSGFQGTLNIRHHFSAGDPTSDLFIRGEYAFSDRVSVAMWMAAAEYFNMSLETRNARKIRKEVPRGVSNGDLYLGTYVNVLKEKSIVPYTLLSINLKTASGSGIEAGRVTETPGYYFDLLFSKQLISSGFQSLRVHAGGGLYVYQTFDGLHFQNDAFLYTIGAQYHFHKHMLKSEFAGYSGYLDIGDRPSVLRTSYFYKTPSLHYIVGYQMGLNDYPYHTLSLGVHYIWRKIN